MKPHTIRLSMAIAIVTITMACMNMSTSTPANAFGALAIDSNHGTRYGWAVRHKRRFSAQDAALKKCGRGCRIILRITNHRCGAYAADQTPGSSIHGWALSKSRKRVKKLALRNCRKYGGKRCTIRVWACE